MLHPLGSSRLQLELLHLHHQSRVGVQVGVTRPDVLVPIATLAKGLGAEETAIRLFAGVDALVVLEGVRPVEALAALLTLVAPLAAMD